jgi:hypothetical protein
MRHAFTSTGLLALALFSGHPASQEVRGVAVPSFAMDATWPPPLPDGMVLGMVASVSVDKRDHVWVLHRPSTVPTEELADGHRRVAPPVIELDERGRFVRAWGGPGPGYSWMEGSTDAPSPVGTPAEHGIAVDDEDNVWVTGNGHVVLKFTTAGRFLLQIGELWRPSDGACVRDCAHSNDTRHFGNPTDIAIDVEADEIFVSDGYVNHRVVVFDTETGAYKRHWGAYGRRPVDGPDIEYDPDKPPPDQFFKVHCVALSQDHFVYACDRQRNRVQVFRTDGTFVSEAVIAPATRGFGSVFGVAFSADPEQRFLFVADSTNGRVWVLSRRELEVLGSFEARGLHHIGGADSRGYLYVTGDRTPRRYRPIR